MSRTISAEYAGFLYLDGSIDNPLSITSTGIFDAGLEASSYGSLWTITNDGSILGVGLTLDTGGSVINTGSIDNSSYLNGVLLQAGGYVSNAASGIITSRGTGIHVQAATAILVNAGLIAGHSSNGIFLGQGGYVANQAGGVINGGTYGWGVLFAAAGTLVNAGSIAGTYGAVDFQAGVDNRLVIQAGASFGGAVDGHNGPGGTGTSTLELTSSASAGTLSGLGSQFTGFTQTTIDADASWALSGANTLAIGYGLSNLGTLTITDTLTNDSVLVTSGTLINSGTLNGFGTIIMTGHGTLIGAGTIDGTETVIQAYGTSVAGAGSITNPDAATLIGGTNGVFIGGQGTVDNSGNISGIFGAGVVLQAGGEVTNALTGSIYGSPYGIDAMGGATTVTNAGAITGTAYAIRLAAGYANRVIVDAGATFTGIVDGGNPVGGAAVSTLELATGGISGLGIQVINFAQIQVDAGAYWEIDTSSTFVAGVTLTNAGMMYGVSNAVYFNAGGSVTNQATGTIEARDYGIRFEAGAGTVVNDGAIASYDGAGVWLRDGGVVTNTALGLLSGYYNGVLINSASGTVVNAGTISGAYYAVRLGSGFNNRLIIDPGAIFDGLVDGGNGSSSAFISTLELRSAAVPGILSGLGTKYIHFANQIVETSAAWLLSGPNTIAAGQTMTNLGTLTNGGVLLDDGTLINSGTLDGNGTIVLTGHGTIIDTGGIAGTETIIQAFGTSIAGAGSVTNPFGTTLLGGSNGIYIGGLGTISNSGIAIGIYEAGAVLNAGGYANNAATGTLRGFGWGLLGAGQATTVVNAGSIDASYGSGVALQAGGVVTNLSGGTISGFSAGVSATDPALLTVNNAGMILGSGLFAPAVNLVAGLVTNQTNGTITGRYAGIHAVSSDVTVVNAGLIAATDILSGIKLDNGGSVTNQSSGTIAGIIGLINADNYATVLNAGTIAGGLFGIYALGATTLANTGRIVGTGASGAGVYLKHGGIVTNQTSGTIAGAYNGIYTTIIAATVSNAGHIGGGTGNGVWLESAGYLDNSVDGTISGGQRGVYTAGTSDSTVVNAGRIQATGAGTGVDLHDGGSLVNQMGGTISGYNGFTGGHGLAGLTVTNAGAIIGTNDAVLLGAGLANRLVIDPGAVFVGAVSGGNPIGATAVSTIELASAATTGTLSGLGTQFTNFAATTIDTGASWTLTGTNTQAAGTTLTNNGTLTLLNTTLADAGTIINNGRIVIDPSTLTVADLAGTGTTVIDAASTMTIFGSVAAGETIEFAGSSGRLSFDPTHFLGQIHFFQAGDTIALTGVTGATSPHIVNGNTLEITTASGTVDLTLDAGHDFSAVTFTTTASGLVTTDNVPCFCPGTLIRTDRGEIAVEMLRVGDLVLTASGAIRPITWIGQRRMDLTRHPMPHKAQPIRVRADAFAAGVPARDLYLSPEHAVLWDGLLVPIRLLVNHATIQRQDRRSVTYYHVELETHDILLAENLPVESYLDTGNRGMFANAVGPLVLHPDLTNDQDRREAQSCFPFADEATRVHPIWQALVARAGQLGLALPEPRATTPNAGLHLLAGGQRITPIAVTNGRHEFLLPAGAEAVRLISRAGWLTDAEPWHRDDRRLGVQVRGLSVRSGATVDPVALDHPALGDGWHPVERPTSTMLIRWTTGDALVVLPADAAERRILTVDVSATIAYGLEDVGVREDFAA